LRSFETLIILFFFSSRRRHTRFSRDWSSDVCSSDLLKINPQKQSLLTTTPLSMFKAPEVRMILLSQLKISKKQLMRIKPAILKRSEERRVGKECRSRGSTYQ